MIASGGGSIVNFSSWLALMGTEKPAYSAAKGGVISFTRALACEYMKHGIRANAVAPATIRTARSIRRWESDDPAAKPTPAVQARMVATRKLFPFSVGESHEMAAIVVFLASDESRLITGQVIAADGGRSSCFRMNLPES